VEKVAPIPDRHTAFHADEHDDGISGRDKLIKAGTIAGDYGSVTVTFRVGPSPSDKVEDTIGDFVDVEP